MIQKHGSPINNFTSEKGWLVWGYDPLNIRPRDCLGAGSMYDDLFERYTGGCLEDVNAEEPGPIRARINATGCHVLRHQQPNLTINNNAWQPGGYNGGPAVVFVSGDMTIGEDIFIRPETGIIFVVGGDINTEESVENIAGMFIFDGSFDDMSGDEKLVIRGALVGGFNDESFGFRRDLGADNENDPAEHIIYEPKYLWLFRDIVGDKNTILKEVAP
ncbi:MAG: hypothetical protein A2Z24_00200 [Candidatus Woykebacteria bacterium RBG_16_44_10]|uniref:Uncharacterized protein n=1 Tax=Candidatus Woykebacteria bacterium RBG_16_44_10 TaxID=1802597 RepID=A0A1G1WGG7_9BACT|nr:MAG: hypothetical protein A2Z24_00200 [Candidatus Woykebacteria bacterium RBG_16_44_10]